MFPKLYQTHAEKFMGKVFAASISILRTISILVGYVERRNPLALGIQVKQRGGFAA